MNIIYINHYAGSFYHGMEFRPYYLAREWVKLGHNVTIIASNFSHLRTKNIIMPDGNDYLKENIDGISYIWCKTSPYQINGIKRVFNIFQFLSKIKKLIPELLKLQPNVVIASSTYPFDSRIAKKIAQQSKAKFIYEVHDLWPLTPMELGGMSKYHPFIWLMQRAENYGYKNADRVVSLLPCALEYMCEHGMDPNKFVYIPNGVDIANLVNLQQNKNMLPLEHQTQIEQLKAQFTLLMGYAGGMSESNALEYIIAVAKATPDVAYVLIGDGVNKQQLSSQVQTDKMPNVFFLTKVDKNQIPAFLKEMDILYIGWHKLSIYRFGICPNKIFDYMLSGKPILHSVTAGNDLVRDANCGISVPAEDINAIINAVNKFTQMSAHELQILGENGYNYVIKHHDYATLAKQFLSNLT